MKRYFLRLEVWADDRFDKFGKTEVFLIDKDLAIKFFESSLAKLEKVNAKWCKICNQEFSPREPRFKYCGIKCMKRAAVIRVTEARRRKRVMV